MQADTSSELHVCFKRSYDTVLRHHHTFLVRSVVSVRVSSLLICVLDSPHLLVQVAIRAVPHRRDFYRQISQGGSPEKLDVELAKWLAGLDAIVKHMCAFLEQGGFGKV